MTWSLPNVCLTIGMVAALAVGSARADDATTRSVVDARGVSVQVPAKPQRVASISYLAADVALAVGVTPVATTYMTAGREPDYLMGLTAGMKKIGQRAKPNLELLAEAKPDLIVAMRRYTQGNAAQFEKIAPYLAYNMELYSESFKEVAELAALLGQPQRGQELNDAFQKRLDEYAAKAPKDKHPRFQIMWAGNTPFTFHTENMAAWIATKLGGENIAGPMAQGGRFGLEMSLESMLEKDPEVIFVYDSGPERPHQANPIWNRLSAVKNGRVHYVGDEWVEPNGPIARELVLREAAHFLYPDHFPAINVKAEAATLIPAAVQK
jgi:iron complex transport system substrate-binding protein